MNVLLTPLQSCCRFLVLFALFLEYVTKSQHVSRDIKEKVDHYCLKVLDF